MDELTIAEFRKMRKRAGVCRDCGKVDAYTMAGRTLCFECAEKNARKKREARKDEAKAEKMRAASRKARAKKVAEHRCVRCGHRLPKDWEKKMCSRCLVIQRRQVMFYHDRKYGIPNERGKNGICWQCNKKPVMEGKKLCKECYEKKVKISLINLEKARENHPWKGKFLIGKKLRNSARYLPPREK